MKLYTRTGDDGTTGLIGGGRVGKDDLRLDAYGTVDELNALLGLAASTGGDLPLIAQVQSDLFAIGSHLAAPGGGTDNIKLPALPDAARLESEIDGFDEKLPALKTFILPGGSELASRLHVARCVCRRAERACVALARHDAVAGVPDEVVTYLNRLSDWLFARARLANHDAGVADVPWTP
ncbi:MAG: cob(I)yrinic acid a,c-diamide adenosyltransferase [Planctomycetota bacterium]